MQEEVGGALRGVVIGVKDIIDVAGLPTAAGFTPWRDRLAERSAPCIARLLDAGAVVLGKTVTTQFACFDPPPTRHPLSDAHTPGGSSSGSAVAIATEMCHVALGTQTGGSIIRPAAYCGVVGFKPTRGKVSTAGVVPVSHTLDHVGPITRSVADAAAVFRALLGDSQSGPSLQGIDSHCAAPPRLGLLRRFVAPRVEPAMQKAMQVTCDRLGEAGAELVEIEEPLAFDAALEHHRVIMAYEAAAYHRERFAEHRDHYLPGMTSLIQEGLAVGEQAYREAMTYRAQLIEAMDAPLRSVDAVIMPATPGPAPDRSTTGDPAFNAPWSLLGVPAITLPMGHTAEGLPLGLQLSGAADTDDALLAVAGWVESAIAQR